MPTLAKSHFQQIIDSSLQAQSRQPRIIQPDEVADGQKVVDNLLIGLESLKGTSGSSFNFFPDKWRETHASHGDEIVYNIELSLMRKSADKFVFKKKPCLITVRSDGCITLQLHPDKHRNYIMLMPNEIDRAFTLVLDEAKKQNQIKPAKAAANILLTSETRSSQFSRSTSAQPG